MLRAASSWGVGAPRPFQLLGDLLHGEAVEGGVATYDATRANERSLRPRSASRPFISSLMRAHVAGSLRRSTIFGWPPSSAHPEIGCPGRACRGVGVLIRDHHHAPRPRGIDHLERLGARAPTTGTIDLQVGDLNSGSGDLADPDRLGDRFFERRPLVAHVRGVDPALIRRDARELDHLRTWSRCRGRIAVRSKTRWRRLPSLSRRAPSSG